MDLKEYLKNQGGDQEDHDSNRQLAEIQNLVL